MKVLLILHSEKEPGGGVIVSVKARSVRDRLVTLLEENRSREAFNLLKKMATPEVYLPAGQKPDEPLVTLVEDDLR